MKCRIWAVFEAYTKGMELSLNFVCAREFKKILTSNEVTYLFDASSKSHRCLARHLVDYQIGKHWYFDLMFQSQKYSQSARLLRLIVQQSRYRPQKPSLYKLTKEKIFKFYFDDLYSIFSLFIEIESTKQIFFFNQRVDDITKKNLLFVLLSKSVECAK